MTTIKQPEIARKNYLGYANSPDGMLFLGNIIPFKVHIQPAMHNSARLLSPLTLTERIKTPFGLLRIILSNYQPSGLMSVELTLDKQPSAGGRAAPVTALSIDTTEEIELDHGEFVAKPCHELMMQTFLDSGLFKAAGKTCNSGLIWRLSGTAMLEFNSAFAPSKAASRASFPSHLFGRRHFDPAGKQMLADEFDKQGYTEHSPSGESVWVIREYCERNRIPFVIYLINEKEEVIGARVCKAEIAKKLEAQNKAEGYSLVTVYESPRSPWHHTDFQVAHH
jgi:hypothetical protein